MKVKITVITWNEEPMPPCEKRPTEAQIVEGWQDIFDMLSILAESNDRAIVESAEYIEED